MSDYPFKVGDLVKVRSTITRDKSFQKSGVIISIDEKTGMFEVLVEDLVRTVHKNYIVTPQIKKINFSGKIKE